MCLSEEPCSFPTPYTYAHMWHTNSVCICTHVAHKPRVHTHACGTKICAHAGLHEQEDEAEGLMATGGTAEPGADTHTHAGMEGVEGAAGSVLQVGKAQGGFARTVMRCCQTQGAAGIKTLLGTRRCS